MGQGVAGGAQVWKDLWSEGNAGKGHGGKGTVKGTCRVQTKWSTGARGVQGKGIKKGNVAQREHGERDTQRRRSTVKGGKDWWGTCCSYSPKPD